MQKIMGIFRLRGVHSFLFGLFFLLFGWPLLTIVEQQDGAAIFIYIFLLWGIIICLLMLMARCLKPRETEEHNTAPEESDV